MLPPFRSKHIARDHDFAAVPCWVILFKSLLEGEINVFNRRNHDLITFDRYANALVGVQMCFARNDSRYVKSQFVDLLGGYSLALPVGAPLLGQYGSGTLPITLSAQSAVAGKYTVEASALGYTTQSVAKDISAANTTQNFTLIP